MERERADQRVSTSGYSLNETNSYFTKMGRNPIGRHILPWKCLPVAYLSICSLKRLQRLLAKIKRTLLDPYPLMHFVVLAMALYKCNRCSHLRIVSLTQQPYSETSVVYHGILLEGTID